MSFLADFCSFKVLTKELSNVCHSFHCDDVDLSEFFVSDFIQYQNDLFGKSYCFTLDEDPRQIVCAFTISNDSIRANIISKTDKNRLSRRISNQKRGLKSYPAVLIGRLGVSMDFERRGIGRELIEFIKYWFIEPHNKTGCRFLVVDAYNKNGPLEFYLKNGFNYIFKDMEEEKKYSGILDHGQLNTRLMTFDLMLIST